MKYTKLHSHIIRQIFLNTLLFIMLLPQLAFLTDPVYSQNAETTTPAATVTPAISETAIAITNLKTLLIFINFNLCQAFLIFLPVYLWENGINSEGCRHGGDSNESFQILLIDISTYYFSLSDHCQQGL